MENSVHIDEGRTEELNDNCLLFAKYTRPQTLKIMHRTESLLSRSLLCIEIMPQIVCNPYYNSYKNFRNELSYQNIQFYYNNRNTEQNQKEKKKKPKKYTRKQINSLQMVKVSFPKQAPSYISQSNESILEHTLPAKRSYQRVGPKLTEHQEKVGRCLKVIKYLESPC